jgi:hypothetical protein
VIEIDIASLLGAESRPAVSVTLPSLDRVVTVATVLRRETRSTSEVPRAGSCWAPNKPSLLFDGQVTWTEFVIVRLLERAGWEGRWIKNWGRGREFCLAPDLQRDLPATARKVFDDLHRRAFTLRGAGSWDVFGWKGDEYLFLESKKFRSSDRLNKNQIAWLEAALLEGFSPAQFVIVEYDVETAQPLVREHRASLDRESSAARMATLLDRAARAGPSRRIEFRDRIAEFGPPAVAAMQGWLSRERLTGLAIPVLEVISHKDRKARHVLEAYARSHGRDEALARAALARIGGGGPAATRPRAVTDVYQSTGSPEREIPGGCQVMVRGRLCNNPGRHIVGDVVTCTTHRKSLERRAVRDVERLAGFER